MVNYRIFIFQIILKKLSKNNSIHNKRLLVEKFAHDFNYEKEDIYI